MYSFIKTDSFMKTIIIFLLSCIITLSAIAQTTNTLTINVRGDQTQQVIVDGRTYTVTSDNSDVNGRNVPITITDLSFGQHTLKVIRTDDINDNSNTTYFNLRSGYDLQITITANGSVQQRESRWGATSNAGYASPMSDADYNALYRNISTQWSSSTRVALLNQAFANSNNYFTTAQVNRLIQLINSQSSRLSLAKASYRSITDPTNFSQIYSLLNSQAYRNELQTYVNNYTANNTSSSTGMTSTRFNNLYRTAQRQTSQSSRVSYISNAFNNTSNYFTVAQARQLIQLVTGESNRLYLAKVSYRGIVDPSNFYRIHELLNSQASRSELTVYTNTYNNGSGNTTNTNMAMSDADFNSLYRDVQNRWGLSAKMSALTNIFNNASYYFTVAQAKQLIQLVSSESNRLDLAKSSYNNIVDTYNFSQLYDVLSSQASRNELDTYVRNNYNYQTGTGSTNTYRTPMSDASFNAIYNDVSSRWGFGAKMSALTDVFNNESNYFTVSQAKKLVQLVSDESNRLQLAKYAYGNITDPQNFTSMYDVLASQSSRDELAAYVSSYSGNQ
jgi:hypothetical protein